MCCKIWLFRNIKLYSYSTFLNLQTFIIFLDLEQFTLRINLALNDSFLDLFCMCISQRLGKLSTWAILSHSPWFWFLSWFLFVGSKFKPHPSHPSFLSERFPDDTNLIILRVKKSLLRLLLKNMHTGSSPKMLIRQFYRLLSFLMFWTNMFSHMAIFD